MRKQVIDPAPAFEVSTGALPERSRRTINNSTTASRGLLPRVNSAGFFEPYFDTFRSVISAAGDDLCTVTISKQAAYIEDLQGPATLMQTILQRLNRSRSGRRMQVSGARLSRFLWGRASCTFLSVSAVRGFDAAMLLFANAVSSFYSPYCHICFTVVSDTPIRKPQDFFSDVLERSLLKASRWQYVSYARAWASAPSGKYGYHFTLRSSSLPLIGSFCRLVEAFGDVRSISVDDPSGFPNFVRLDFGNAFSEDDFSTSVPPEFVPFHVRPLSLFGSFFVAKRRTFKPFGRLCFR